MVLAHSHAHAHRRWLWLLAALAVTSGCSGATDSPAPPESPPPSSEAGAPAPPSTPSAPPSVTPAFAGLDAFLDARLAAGLHGLAMQIYDRDDHLVYQREAGVCATPPACPAGSPAFTVNLVTGIASSSKWVTSSTVLAVLDDAVAAGRAPSIEAALDRKVAPALSCAAPITGPLADITMRHLLSFTSGVIPDHPCVTDRTSTLTSCACEILADSATVMTTTPTQATARKTASPPGTTYKYGASHLAIAGAVVEALTGKPWDDVFRTKILDPLQISMTYKSDVNLAGSISSSVVDYARFVGAVFHDGLGDGPKRILSKEAVLAQRAKQVPDAAVPLLIPQEGRDYGLNTWRWCYAPFDVATIADPTKLVNAPACDGVFQSGHGGKGGYQPFLDAGGGRYYAVLAIREESTGDGASYTPEEVSASLGVRLVTHLAMTPR